MNDFLMTLFVLVLLAAGVATCSFETPEKTTQEKK